ncbi:hypothetical protein D6833_10925 [Candidatus Parcubacteria bacterium]|nr:MAG: hypothetical protein D6833_10925 [Candidatus Parcubacteria bacterium]
MGGLIIIAGIGIYASWVFIYANHVLKIIDKGDTGIAVVATAVPLLLISLTIFFARKAAKKADGYYWWYVNHGDVIDGRVLMMRNIYNQYGKKKEKASDTNACEAPAPVDEDIEVPRDAVDYPISEGPAFSVDQLPQAPDGYGIMHIENAPILDRTLVGIGMTTKGLTLMRMDDNRAVFRDEETGETRIYPLEKTVVIRGACYKLQDFDSLVHEMGYYRVDRGSEWEGHVLEYEGPRVIMRVVHPTQGPDCDKYILVPSEALMQEGGKSRRHATAAPQGNAE